VLSLEESILANEVDADLLTTKVRHFPMIVELKPAY
jgi:hypothetical protein